MEQPTPSPSSMDGLWAFTVGGLVMAALMTALEQPYRWSQYLGMPDDECANYMGNGNAGPFAYTSWEYLLPLLSCVWVLLIGVEQALLSARTHRIGASYAIRAALVLVTAIALACWFPLGLAVKCG